MAIIADYGHSIALYFIMLRVTKPVRTKGTELRKRKKSQGIALLGKPFSYINLSRILKLLKLIFKCLLVATPFVYYALQISRRL